MTTRAPILTEAVISAAMEHAERAVCLPGDARCYGFPYSVEEALATLHSDGWCCIGWVAASAGRQTWDVWFHVDTGVLRHEKQQDR